MYKNYAKHTHCLIIIIPITQLCYLLSQLPHYSQVWTSFQKLMRACAPSLPHSSSVSKYRLLVEDSDWLNQVSNIMQLAGAVADLLDLQGSSVLVAMENGSDATIQVSVKPHYTISQRDWLLPHYRRSGNFGVSKFCSIKFSVHLLFVVSLGAQIVRSD